MREARFSSAHLQGSEFSGCDLSGADFRGANLAAVPFDGAALRGARFQDARLLGADFRRADLSGARELTPQQLAQAFTTADTVLPNGARGPYLKHSGAERPARRLA